MKKPTKKQGTDALKSDPKKLAADKARQDAKKAAAKTAPAKKDKAFADKVAKVTPAGQAVAKTPQYDVVATAKKKIESEQLAPYALEINKRFQLAAQLDVKSDDHRLSAALQLEKAKKICDENKINFREWVETNLDQSYQTVRKLIYVAVSPEPAKALADMRERNKDANKKHRDKKKAPEGKQGPTVTPFKRAAEAVDALTDSVAVELVKGVAKKAGMAVVSETELKTLRETAKAPAVASAKVMPTATAIREMFTGMSATERMAFVEWAAEQIGFQVSNPLSQAERDEKDAEIPAALRRRKPEVKAAE